MSAPKTYEAFEHLATFISECKTVLKDGWQPASDIPSLLSDIVKDLVPILGDAAGIAQEFKDSPVSVWIEVAKGATKLFEAAISPE